MSAFINMSSGYSTENTSSFWTAMKNNDLYLRERIESIPKGVLSWKQITNTIEVPDQFAAGVSMSPDLFDLSLDMEPGKCYELLIMIPHMDNIVSAGNSPRSCGITFNFQTINGVGGSFGYLMNKPGISTPIGVGAGPIGYRVTQLSLLSNPNVGETVGVKISPASLSGPVSLIGNETQRIVILIKEKGDSRV